MQELKERDEKMDKKMMQSNEEDSS